MQDTNSLGDEIRLQHEKLKGQSWQKKLDYFWDYYKIHVIIIILAACMFGSFLHGIINKKETVLSVAYINAFSNIDDEIFMDDFEEFININPKKQQALLDSSYYIDENSTSPYAATYSQKFSTMAMAGELDVVVADEENFSFYGKQGFFQDLTKVLTKEQISQYQDSFLYCDLPNDEVDGEVPVGINVTKANKICATESYPNKTAYYGVITGSANIDYALSYLNYLFE